MPSIAKSPPELVAAFAAGVPMAPGVVQKAMFGCPCAFVNGNMFTGLFEQEWLVRLSEADRAELTALGGRPFAPMGRAMREYLLLPPSVRQDPSQLADWLGRSLAFAAAIPPKAAKPKRAAKAKAAR